MPVFKLTDDLFFPSPHLADPDGLLAIGGDLTPQRLLLAYSSGLFPWFNEGQPPLWWCPDPRCIFEPGQVGISRSLVKTLRKKKFVVTCDQDFAGVINACASVRKGQGEETWITGELSKAFLSLHEMGYAHSIECWLEGELTGGLYGICLGRCFFGESMFHTVADSSKVAFAHLLKIAEANRFELVDGQLSNSHLISLGAKEISRSEFLERINIAGVVPSISPIRGNFSLPSGIASGWD